MREFSDVFLQYKPKLAEVESRILDFAKGKSPLIGEISQHLVSSGGKRIRPLLHLLVADLCKSSNQQANYNLAAAIELIHSATLLHDDVVDNSSSRRGKDTANEIWDNKAPILVGDYLFSVAFQLMVKAENLEVLDLLAKSSSIMADGEVMQLENSCDVALSKEKYFEIIYGKTAVLFVAACESAALLAAKDDSEIAALAQFGKNLGILFQIVDDILDYEANDDDLGKDIGDDFFEGKVTLPIILLQEKCDEKERTLIAEIMLENFEAQSKNQQNLELIKNLLQKYDIMTLSKELANSFKQRAKDNLDQFKDCSAYDDLLVILDYSMKRIA